MSRPHLREAASGSHVAAVLTKIREEGFVLLDDFIMQFLRCSRPSIKAQADKFFAEGGSQRVVNLILDKQDRMRDVEEQYVKGKALANDCVRRMSKDIKKLEEVDFLRMKARSLGPDDINQFTFQAFDDQYSQKAPFIYHIVRQLCGVHDDETVSKPGFGPRANRRGKGPVSAHHSESESEDTEKGGDEGTGTGKGTTSPKQGNNWNHRSITYYVQ